MPVLFLNRRAQPDAKFATWLRFFVAGTALFLLILSGGLGAIYGTWNQKPPPQVIEHCENWTVIQSIQAATVESVIECLETLDHVDARDKYEATMLHYLAAYNENPSVLSAVLDAGADVNVENENGITPLHVAASSNRNPAIITTLVRAGADVNQGEHLLRLTPLHSAAAHTDNPCVIVALLGGGADVNARDIFGSTPLYEAFDRNRNESIVEVLLLAGSLVYEMDEMDELDMGLTIEVDPEAENPNDTIRKLDVYRRLQGELETSIVLEC